MTLIDSHAHLTFPELRDQANDVIARAREAGVGAIITIGTDLADTRAAIALAERFPGVVCAAGAFHPHEAQAASHEDLDALAQLWDHPRIVAIGEIGLDYHYDFADRTTQRRVLIAQLQRASKRRKPLVIHCRDAFEDTVPILLDHGYAQRPVVFHCFTGTNEEAALLAGHGWRISFTGIVTFRKSTWLQEIAKDYPADHLMIETDSPYLSPHPIRGRHPNEPSHLLHTARSLAELRGTSLDAFMQQTASNTRAFFGIADNVR